MGRKHLPYYRIVATEAQKGRNSREIEILGTYDPNEKDPEKVAVYDSERVKYWLSVGAQPTETVQTFLKKQGVA